VVLSNERQREVKTRPMSAKLACIQALDDGVLTEARILEKRLVGNCSRFHIPTEWLPTGGYA
jgi:hypothetical protein